MNGANKMNFINTWGCAHFMEDVISEDLRHYNLGAPVRCIADDNEILTCQYKNKTVRILKSGWTPRKKPEFVWNDAVLIKAKNVIAKVDLICWHLNDGRYFYYLILDNGKKLSRRYFAEELKKVG